MEIKIQKSVLENILQNIQPFLEKKDTTQITSHILICAKSDSLEFKGTDYEIGLAVKTSNAQVLEEGITTANGKKLADIIKILKDDEVTLKLENETIHIHQKHSRFKLPVFNSIDFPAFPNFENFPKLELNSLNLIASFKKISPAIDNNNPKYELNGALIDIQNEHINIVSTDTRRLAITEIANTSAQALSIIIPKKAIVEIQKLFFENVDIYYNETYMIIQSTNYTFFTKLINGNYPNYERIIPKELKNTLTIPKNLFIDAIKQVNIATSDIKLIFNADNITFEALSDDTFEAKTYIELNTPFQNEFTIAMNSRYVLDFLAQINTSEFKINLNESNQPFTLESETFKTIVMPIAI